MAVTERARHELYNQVREAWGEEVAATMMELLPPSGWSDVARQSDMELRFAAIDRRFDAIDQRFESIDHRFESIEHRFESIEHRFDSIAGQLAQTNRFMGWLIATNSLVIGMLTLVVTLAG
jgi:tetrahydromethanopterin S-methyltransferase subunit G